MPLSIIVFLVLWIFALAYMIDKHVIGEGVNWAAVIGQIISLGLFGWVMWDVWKLSH